MTPHHPDVYLVFEVAGDDGRRHLQRVFDSRVSARAYADARQESRANKFIVEAWSVYSA